MARPYSIMGGKALTRALNASECAFHITSKGQSVRGFASSAICQTRGGVPIFSKTSSTELDDILATIRKKVFLPAYLSKAQRELVYKDKYKRMLTSEPVLANVNGEEFKLEHIDRTIDVPNMTSSLYKILALMQDKRDWDNLPLLLRGMTRTGIRRKAHLHYVIVKQAALAGRLDVALECVRMASETGFYLSDIRLVERLVLKIQANAMDSDWGSKETKKALSWVETISTLLEEEKHRSKSVSVKEDPRMSPVVMGVLLELASIRASWHLDGKDEDGKVARYTNILLDLDFDALKPVEKSPDNDQLLHEINRWMLSVAPILHGMEMAQKVLDPASEDAKKLKLMTAELKHTISQERDILVAGMADKPFGGTGLATFEKLLA